MDEYNALSAVEIELYSTLGCHLCELALALYREEPLAAWYRLAEIDIIDDDSLLSRYGERIPVLRRGDIGTELGWPFDAQQLRVFLRRN